MFMKKHNLYCLGFSHCYGIGPIKFKTLINYFDSPEAAYRASQDELTGVLGSNLAERFIQFRARFDLEKKQKELDQKGIIVLTQQDTGYPQALLNISDPPICLYVKGDIHKINFKKEFFFAVVGTRKPTSYGEQLTKKFANELTLAGLTIVSGLAIGVDALAHSSCLSAGGKTVAVLGCGVDIIYPAANSNLYYQIVNGGGLVVSEFPPGHTVLKGLFIARNRLISGLSKGVLIIEGGKDSGALITARYAAEQGKEVFAPPAPITSEMSTAPNLLLKQGAKLVTSVEDILEEFNLKKTLTVKQVAGLSSEEKQIYEVVNIEPITTDDLIDKTKLPAGKLLSVLSMMEIKGLVEKDSSGKYVVKQ